MADRYEANVPAERVLPLARKAGPLRLARLCEKFLSARGKLTPESLLTAGEALLLALAGTLALRLKWPGGEAQAFVLEKRGEKIIRHGDAVAARASLGIYLPVAILAFHDGRYFRMTHDEGLMDLTTGEEEIGRPQAPVIETVSFDLTALCVRAVLLRGPHEPVSVPATAGQAADPVP